MRALDIFAGCGGWDVACDALGIEVDGIEILPEAVATRQAAGLRTVGLDVRDWSTEQLFALRGVYDLLLASPPCQSFSAAGRGAGRKALDVVLAGVARYAAPDPAAWPSADELVAMTDDERTVLVLEPLRYALALQPDYLAWEQVPPVLPVWEACAVVLRAQGYSVATAKLSAERYGVPQTRNRAILVAALDGEARLPAPTHRPYKKGVAQHEGDQTLLPWVSMAEALGWGMTARPSTTLMTGNNGGGPDPMSDGSGSRSVHRLERAEGRWAPGQDIEVHVDRGAGLLERYGTRPGRSITAPAPTIRAGSKCSGPNLVYKRADGASPEPVEMVGFLRRADGRDDGIQIGDESYRARDLRPTIEPASAVTEKTRSWTRLSMRNNTSANACEREADEPAGTIYYGQRANGVYWKLRQNHLRPNGTDRWVGEPAPTITAGKDHAERRWIVVAGLTGEGRPRSDADPAPTVTTKGTAYTYPAEPVLRHSFGISSDSSWTPHLLPVGCPAPTVDTKSRSWLWELDGDAFWDYPVESMLYAAPAAEPVLPGGGWDGAVTTSKGGTGVRVTVAEAAALQSFPPQFPFQGSMTKRYLQVGNAIPPLLARAILADLVPVEIPVQHVESMLYV